MEDLRVFMDSLNLNFYINFTFIILNMDIGGLETHGIELEYCMLCVLLCEGCHGNPRDVSLYKYLWDYEIKDTVYI